MQTGFSVHYNIPQNSYVILIRFKALQSKKQTKPKQSNNNKKNQPQNKTQSQWKQDLWKVWGASPALLPHFLIRQMTFRQFVLNKDP